MKKSNVINHLMLLTVLGFLLPHVTLAAQKSPTCALTATIEGNELKLKNKSTLLLHKGIELKIAWTSQNTRSAYDNRSDTIETSGYATSTVTRNEVHKYTFRNNQKKVDCEFRVKTASGVITTTRLDRISIKSVIEGTFKSQRRVLIELQKVGSTNVVYKSAYKTVRGNRWSIKLPSKLTDGDYIVTLRGDSKAAYNILATSSLQIGDPMITTTSQPSSLVVQVVPLLLGGTARAGVTVPIIYLQLINIGSATATLSGFTLRQNGNATTNSIVGLSVADDTGLYKNSVGTLAQPIVFVNNEATVPILANIAPKETRLYTLKASTLPGNYLNVGKQLKLDVIGVAPAPLVRATFPIIGTTWTVGL